MMRINKIQLQHCQNTRSEGARKKANFTRVFPLFPACLLFALCTFCNIASPAAASKQAPRTQQPYSIDNARYYPILASDGFHQKGVASWYGSQFHGRKTSNGETYNMHAMTAAHKILPMNTMLRVKNLDNGKETIVRINDRGPFVRGRIIDLSYAAAKSLGIIKQGTARVAVNTILPDMLESSPQPEGRTAQNRQEKEYYIQIGAFSQQQNAQRLQQYFRNAGHKAIIRTGRSNKKNKPLYLVQVYAGTLYKHAQKAEKVLLAKGYDNAFLIAHQ